MARDQDTNSWNNQCARKDFVVLVSRLLVVELSYPYESFEIKIGMSLLVASAIKTSLSTKSCLFLIIGVLVSLGGV
jgi:hypothetical protein